MADDVAVMYAGRVVETGTVHEMLKAPLHPYTHALLATLPRVDGAHEHLRVMNVCRQEPPPPLARPEGGTHNVACYNPVWQRLD
jgi:oligopeptide/dipeptide ABC transporter ATP-binding protein